MSSYTYTTHGESHPRLFFDVTDLSRDEWRQILHTLLACSFEHRLSRHTKVYRVGTDLVIEDMEPNGRDESAFLGQQFLSCVQPELVSSKECIKECLPSLVEIMAKLFGVTVEQPTRLSFVASQLYKLDSARVFRLFKKVVGHGNNHLESQLKCGCDDVKLLKQLQVSYREREDNDSTDKHRQNQRLSQVQNLLDLSRVGSVLDFGGGNGDFAHAIRNVCRSGCVAHCLDIKRWISKEHTLKHSDVVYNFVDTWVLPYKDATFDLVTMLQVIHHLDHPTESLREIFRVLRPNGRLVVREHDCTCMEDLLCIDLEHFVYEVRFRGNERMCSMYEARYYSQRVLRNMLLDLGFRMVKCEEPSTCTNSYNSLWYKP